jgi:hypothetical protein
MYIQQEFDDKVLAAVSGHLGVMEIAADLRIQGDPQARRLEEEQMFAQNMITALSDYDVSSGLLFDDDIDYLFQMATSAINKFP